MLLGSTGPLSDLFGVLGKWWLVCGIEQGRAMEMEMHAWK